MSQQEAEDTAAKPSRLRNALLQLLLGGEQLTAMAARQLPDTQQVAVLESGATHYALHGPDDGKPLVLVHGYTGPMQVWEPLLPALTAAGYRVLTYDLFGRGRSDRPNGHYDLPLFLTQLQQLLAELGWPEEYDLMGWSMGGLISSAWTSENAAAVRRLILLAPAGMPMAMTATAKLGRLPLIGEFTINLFGERTLTNGEGFFDLKRAASYVRLLGPQMRIRGYRRAALSTLRRMPLDNATAIYERLAQVQEEISVLWGEADQVVPISCADSLAKVVPQAVIHRLVACGHVLQFEQRHKVEALVLEALT